MSHGRPRWELVRPPVGGVTNDRENPVIKTLLADVVDNGPTDGGLLDNQPRGERPLVYLADGELEDFRQAGDDFPVYELERWVDHCPVYRVETKKRPALNAGRYFAAAHAKQQSPTATGLSR